MTAAADTIVRMGELAVSADPCACLVTIGLGSCIGLVIVDRMRKVAGLAHVMLPQARPGQAEGLAPSARGKYADLAVPALVDAMLAAGARRLGLQVALVGGAKMFGAASGTLDVGARNEAAVRDALAAARLRVEGDGDRGREGQDRAGRGRFRAGTRANGPTCR